MKIKYEIEYYHLLEGSCLETLEEVLELIAKIRPDCHVYFEAIQADHGVIKVIIEE